VASPTVITATAHKLKSGDTIYIRENNGSVPSIAGTHTITELTANTFTIPVNVSTAGSLSCSFLKTVAFSADGLNSAALHMTSGKFEHEHGGSELVEYPVIHFKNSTNSIVSLAVNNRADDSRIAAMASTITGSSSVADVTTSAISGNRQALWLSKLPPYDGSVPSVPAAPHDWRVVLFAGGSKYRF